MAIIKRSLGNRCDIIEKAFRKHYTDGLGGLAFEAFRNGWTEAFREVNALAELKTPDAGEFTKDCEKLERHISWERPNDAHQGNQLLRKLFEACDIIDQLEAENKALKEALKTLKGE